MGILNGIHPLDQLFTTNDVLPTKSWHIQSETETSVYRIFKKVLDEGTRDNTKLERDKHIEYLLKATEKLNKYWVVLDASKPWILYWILHSLDLLDHKFTQDFTKRAISTISKCQNKTGGFGGGPGQASHVATTYAALNALSVLGTKEAYDVIDRENLYKWLLRLKKPDGSFIMHEGGEVDVRGAYCAMSVATLTNLLTPELVNGTPEWIKRCQNYDGGIGGVPGVEAHGGYAFCGLAAMEIMGKTDLLNIPKLLKWASSLQMKLEGGFQGRPNKLVDGCYSFWAGALFPLIEAIYTRQQFQKSKEPDAVTSKAISVQPLFDREALQEYILFACQSSDGGLIDKPGRHPDFYHTCYCLSGLSSAQHHVVYDAVRSQQLDSKGKLDVSARMLLWNEEISDRVVIGLPENLVHMTHPVHNVRIPKAHAIIEHFYGDKI